MQVDCDLAKRRTGAPRLIKNVAAWTGMAKVGIQRAVILNGLVLAASISLSSENFYSVLAVPALESSTYQESTTINLDPAYQER